MHETTDNTVFHIEVDRISAKEWSESLDHLEDANIYQTWSYGVVRWGQQNLSHLVLKRGDEIVAMAQLLVVRPRYFRVGMAHLRWGPLCHRKGSELDPEIVLRMATALYDEYVRKRGLFLRILPNAYIKTPRAQVFQSAFSQYRNEPFGASDSFRTLVVDLTSPLEVLRKSLDQKWRNQLNRAERSGLTVREDDETDCFRAFIRIYDEMLARKQFSASSDIREFERIQQDLPKSQRMKVFICEHEGIPAAGLVGTAMGNTAIYLLGATNEQGMKSKGAYLLQWRMIQWLKENGIMHYDLGGINPQNNPGVYHFKQGLSGVDVLYMKPLIACNNIASKIFANVVGLASCRVRNMLNRLFRR